MVQRVRIPLLEAKIRAVVAISLLDSIKRPAVTASPVGTLWARFSFGVVDAFFVGAADNAVCDYNRPNFLRFDECDDLFSNVSIHTYIRFLREPAFQRISIAVFAPEDADRNLRSNLCGRPVEGDGRNRVSAESLLHFSS
jgi:hypothetical protein